MARRRPARQHHRAIGYRRVSTGRQAESGLGLDDQDATIAAEATRRGWELVDVVTDAGASGRSMRNRPGLLAALERLDRGEADILVVSKLDRLARSIVDFGAILERARRNGWAVVILDLGVDTSTSSGELVANVIAAVAQWESRVIGERVEAMHGQRKARGLRAGQAPQLDGEVRARAAAEVASGRTLRAVAADLNAEGVPTSRGGSWHASTVAHIARSVALDAELEAAG